MGDDTQAGGAQTRYRHTNRSGGNQDQGERKDDGWESRQGGRQSRDPGVRGPQHGPDDAGPDRGGKPGGTNTQGDLKGIAEASARVAGEEDGLVSESPEDREARRLEAERRADPRVSEGSREHPRHARMPEGEQNADTRGSGGGGFDVGVDASQVGAPHQGARREDASKATSPDRGS
jgi:hypothetical protein